MPKDPVCAMDVGTNTQFVSEFEGIKYYLCSEGCKSSFEKSPQKYLKNYQKFEIN
jgi:Cu+-exporting ATPase